MPLTNEWGAELNIRIFVYNIMSAESCYKQSISRSTDKLYKQHEELIMSQSPKNLFCFSPEQLIEMNPVCFLLHCCHLPEVKSNFPSLPISDFDPRQIRKLRKRRMPCETWRLSEPFFHTWKAAHSYERGFLQSQRWWHYPFSSQLKFIENIQETLYG